MPRKQKPAASAAKVPFQINKDVLEELIPGPMSAEGVEAIFQQLKKAVLERALNAELTHHLGYPKGGAPPEKVPNHRNGSSAKTVLTDEGPLELAIPRDRTGEFEPQIIGKHERRFAGFDDKIISM
jgi:putative transposase